MDDRPLNDTLGFDMNGVSPSWIDRGNCDLPGQRQWYYLIRSTV